MRNQVLLGHVIDVLKKMQAKSVHCVVTSPPYYALRSYGVPVAWPEVTYTLFGFEIVVPPMSCELGHEPDPKAFIGHMVLTFREVHRVLRDDGTCWVNMGDSYASSGKDRTEQQATENTGLQGSTKTQTQILKQQNKVTSGLKPKDLIGIPWMLAFALREDGWYLRQDIIWFKRNPMPESVTDRCTKSHEYVFMLAKSQKYYYDAQAIRTESKWNPNDTKFPDGWDTGEGSHGSFHRNGREKGKKMKSLPEGQSNIRKAKDKQRGHSRRHAGFNDRWDQMSKDEQMSMGANKRSVWDIPTKPFKAAHFAVFPEELIVDMIKAGTSEYCCSECGNPYVRQVEKELVPTKKAGKTFIVDGRDHIADGNDQGSNRQKDGHKPSYIYQSKTTGWQPTCSCNATTVNAIVVDIFSGSGTTGIVSSKLNRDFVLIECKPEYLTLSVERIRKELGIFNPM